MAVSGPKTLNLVTISPSFLAPLTIGATVDFTTIVNGGGATTPVVFNSSDPTVASINNAGHLVALSAGSTVITATVNGVPADFPVTVTVVSPAPPPAPPEEVVAVKSKAKRLANKKLKG